MKPWKDLSMKERGAFIRVGVKNGITSVDGIRGAYNKFACGGHKFDGTSGPTQWMFRNKSNPNDLISEAQFEEMFGVGDERFKNYEGVRVAIPRQAMPQQQEVDHLYKDGRLDEITVRPDIAYNSDVRNIPALETTEEPISDEWRKRFARSNAQLRRQAQMTPAEQWANYYTNLANLSYEDRLALENDRKFKRFIGGVAGGLITAPVTIPAIAGSIAYAPEAYSWLMQKGLPAATEFMSTKLNPGWWADQATLGARQLAQKYGLSALESGLSALTGEVGLSGMAGGFSGFGSSTIPGMALNAYLGADMGYNAVNNLINKPFSSPDRTWKDNAWDALGLTGGIATGAELGLESAPEAYNIMKPLMTKARRTYIKANRKFHAEDIANRYIDRLRTRMDEIEGAYIKNKTSARKAKKEATKHARNMASELSQKVLELLHRPNDVQEVKDYKMKLLHDFAREHPNLGVVDESTFQPQVDAYVAKLINEYSRTRNIVDKIANEVQQAYGIPADLGNLKIYERRGINIQKASYDDVETFAKKYGIDISTLLEKGPNGETIIKLTNNTGNNVPMAVRTTFTPGEGDIPIFGSDLDGILKSNKYEVSLVADADIGGGRIVVNPKEPAIDFIDRIRNPKASYTVKEHSDVTPGYDEIHKQNIDYIEKRLGAKIFGSSSVEGIPHWKHDYDVITTDEQAAKVIPGYNNHMLNERGKTVVDLGELEGKGKGYYTTQTSEGRKNFGEIDVNVIQTGKDGKAEGYIAEEIFRQFFPEEYSKAAVEASLNGGSKRVKINKTPQELLKAYDANVKTIMDCLEVGAKPTDNYKHSLRIFGYINNADPEVVAKSIQKAGEMTDGAYKKAPNFDFTDVEANKKLLDRMGVPYIAFADDPQKMQNMFDYYCLNRTTVYRGIYGDYPDYAALNKTYEVWPASKGSMMGYGTNNVGGGSSGHGPFVRLRQLPVNYKGVSSPMEALDRVDRATGANLKLTAEEANFINKKVGNHLAFNLKEGSTSQDLLRVTPTKEGWDALSKALQEIGIYGVEGNDYGNGVYTSVTNNIATTRNGDAPFSIPRYLHHPLDNMSSVENRINTLSQSLVNSAFDTSDFEYVPGGTSNPNKGKVMWSQRVEVPINEGDIPDIPFLDAYKHTSGLPNDYTKDESWRAYNKNLGDWNGEDKENQYNYHYWNSNLQKIRTAKRDAKYKAKTTAVTIGVPAAAIGTAAFMFNAMDKNEVSRGSRIYELDMKEIDAERDSLFEQYRNGEISEYGYRKSIENLEKERKRLNDRVMENPRNYSSSRHYARIDRVKKAQKEYEENKKNKKSYGGPLELNDQYGIGKYINY